MNKLTIVSALAVLVAGCSKSRAADDRDSTHSEAQTPVAISAQEAAGGRDGSGGNGAGGKGSGGGEGTCGAGACG